jgi:bifunctional enzyme CysN/CysC
MPRKKQTQVLQSILPHSLEALIEQQSQQELLRFITCGSVDDGKSTLIGRLLWESSQLLDDQVAALKKDSKRFGTQGDEIDFALLVDGLAAEREQGITIDVAYRFFATNKRKFIVADTPGHEQYTRNMITGASTAQLAILLVDAQAGLLTQTRRHAYLASLMGIRQVVLAINKMDLVRYKQSVFESIHQEFIEFVKPLGFDSVTAIPLSALKGENIVKPSTRTPWYSGPTLLAHLESVPITLQEVKKDTAFAVQWVSRPNADFRGLCGTVNQGQLRVGDRVRVTQSGASACIQEIVTMDGPLSIANAGQAINLKLDHEIDASRGDVLSMADLPLKVTDQFEAHVVWLDTEVGQLGRSYELKLLTQWRSVTITQIKHRIDVNTGQQVATKQLQLNDIAVCHIASTQNLAYDSYRESPALGSFILVDRLTRATVAAGMISHSLRRSDNVHRQALSIDQAQREKLNGHKAQVLWLTGLSGSGKSTLANALELELHKQGYRTYILDGDNLRHGLNKDLGFTETDRIENIRRVTEVARLMLDAGLIVLTAFISPFRSERGLARELIGAEQFLEVFVNTPIEVCESRDVKGLYLKARQGQIPNMTGINSPYEPPLHADVNVDTSSMTLNQATNGIMEVLMKRLLN